MNFAESQIWANVHYIWKDVFHDLLSFGCFWLCDTFLYQLGLYAPFLMLKSPLSRIPYIVCDTLCNADVPRLTAGLCADTPILNLKYPKLKMNLIYACSVELSNTAQCRALGSHAWLGAVAWLWCPASWERIRLLITSLGKEPDATLKELFLLRAPPFHTIVTMKNQSPNHYKSATTCKPSWLPVSSCGWLWPAFVRSFN